MRRYFFSVAAGVGCVVLLHCLVILYVRAPIAAEYWVRELIIAKADLLARLDPPRIIFVGGSSTLFGVDAAQVEQLLGRPAFNFGLHAAMRLEDLFDAVRPQVRPGDVVVLALEPPIYTQGPDWTLWQLRNAFAYDPAAFDRQPLPERLRPALQTVDLQIDFDLLKAKAQKLLLRDTATMATRERALLPPAQIIARFRATRDPSPPVIYSMSDLDDRGDLLHTDGGGVYPGAAATGLAPNGIHPAIADALGRFLGEMRGRHVRVVFMHTPYLIEGAPDASWPRSEAAFARDLTRVGGQLLDRREELFYPREFFFDTGLHLNARGRAVRSARLAGQLRATLSSPIPSPVTP